jgi:UDP-N-acetylglucosamine 2-epimerase (non-hydrolysing)
MKILNIVGARPNFMKVAPLHNSFERYSDINSKIVHTGQHYDERMSDIFFNQLGMPQPDYYLGIGSGSHAVVTAKIMIAFEQIILEEKPDLVLVVGDVNSTLACALVTKKLNIPLAHVESGLRSGDRNMPEEINRILTDSISDFLFVTEDSGIDNLKKEGVPDEKVFFTGNVMIDSLHNFREKAEQLDLIEQLGLEPKKYVLMTMHRPSNVDRKEKLKEVVDLIVKISREEKLVFPLHPRTEKYLKEFRYLEKIEKIENLIILPPQGYIQFIHLMLHSHMIITDSGGIQEETTALGIPCLTIRDSTERPITVDIGSNILIPELDANHIYKQYKDSMEGADDHYEVPSLWDGHAADRITEQIYKSLLDIKLTTEQIATV